MDEALIKILLVEDDEDDFVITQKYLSEIKRWRFNLDWAPDFGAAWKAMKRGEHDVYLVDYRLGSRNGLELIRELQKDHIKSPVILLTGQGGMDVDLEAMKAGAADYLEKDQMNPSMLERSIRYAIERTKTLDALKRKRGPVSRHLFRGGHRYRPAGRQGSTRGKQPGPFQDVGVSIRRTPPHGTERDRPSGRCGKQ
jgi:DNA-binding NtrC family response regulator